jgi:hypothetical protein
MKMKNIFHRKIRNMLYVSHIKYLKYIPFYAVLAVLAFTGCRKNTFTITGTIVGAGKGEHLLLREVKPGVLEPVDSVIPQKDGSFAFRSETQTSSFYVLSMGSDDFLTLLAAPGEKIKVTASRRSLSSPSELSGSEGTAVMVDFRNQQQQVVSELQNLTKVYNDSILSMRLPLIMDSLDRKAAGIVAGFREKAVNLIEDNSSSMVSVYLLNQQVVPGLQLFDPANDQKIYYRVDSLLYAQYPKSDLVLDLHISCPDSDNPYPGRYSIFGRCG